MQFIKNAAAAIAIVGMLGCGHAFATLPNEGLQRQGIEGSEQKGQDQPSQEQANRDKLDAETINDELQIFHTATISLSDAAAVASKLHVGSSTVDVSFDDDQGNPVYRVKTMKQGTIWETTVDARTGSVQNAEASYRIDAMPADDRHVISRLKAVKPSLLDAIAVAERSTQGQALSGGLINSDGQIRFVILIANGTYLKEVILDPPEKLESAACREASRTGQHRRPSCLRAQGT